MVIVSPEGTIYGEKRKVLHFSTQRFYDDVVLGGCCFMCGRAESADVPFNAEHIIPQWILKRYGLYNNWVNVTNGGGVRYDRYTVPCCEDCNGALGAMVETPVKRLLCDGYDKLMSGMSPDTEKLLYCWCSLIYLKTHLKDLALRMVQDRREPDTRIGDFHDWGKLHHIQSVARCPIANVGLGEGAVGSLIIKKVKLHPELKGRYDQGDLSIARTMMIQVDDIGIIAVMDDAKLCELNLEQVLARTGVLHPLQMRELLARVGYLNMRIGHRPTFRTTLDRPDRLEVEIEDEKMPDTVPLHKDVLEDFGKLFDFATHGVPMDPDVRAAVRAGTCSFVFQASGEFIDRPLP